MKSAALAFFLTWTTYGTRLHGDERGTVDRRNNAFGTPRLRPNPRMLAFERSEVSGEVLLDEDRRRVVHEAIVRHAAHRGWDLLALAVRSNHVHVVIRNHDAEPERIMTEFKAWCTRSLRECRGAHGDQRMWTRHGSTRHLFASENVHAAIHYVDERQDDRRRFDVERARREFFERLKEERVRVE
ncbi:MAG: transposase [Phycisphaeraceae bacterium]|nr:transposase [Phycisphaeraceae bacterium]